MSTPAISRMDAAKAGTRVLTEETANQVTHGFGLLLAICGAIALTVETWDQQDLWRVVSAAIYSTTLVALYAASTLSHSFPHRPARRQFFRMVDQVCIYLLIAGTFTPFGLVYLREGWTGQLTLLIWLLAIFGAFFRAFFSYLHSLNATSYVLLGWLPMSAMGEIVWSVPLPAVVLLIVGGLLYTVGTLFFARDGKYPYFHAIWHLMVVAASGCHFWAIYRYIVV